MKKILFPTDFSPLSLNAFSYALHFAKSSNAEIIILHVYDLPIVTATIIDATIYLNEMFEEIDLSYLESFKSKITILKNEGEKIQFDSKKLVVY
jgi:nucleotide-binding universal stress UspA family protein